MTSQCSGRVPSTSSAKMAKMANLLRTCGVIKFVEAVRSHPILWDSRHDDYKLAERKPIVWDGIAAQCECDRCKYMVL